MIYVISNAYLWQTFDKTYNETTFYGLTRLPIKIIAVYINFYLLTALFFQEEIFCFFWFVFTEFNFSRFNSNLYFVSKGIFNYESFTQYSLPVYSVVILSSVLVIIHQFFIKARNPNRWKLRK